MCRFLYVVLLPSGMFTCYKFCFLGPVFFFLGGGVPQILFLNTETLSSKMMLPFLNIYLSSTFTFSSGLLLFNLCFEMT